MERTLTSSKEALNPRASPSSGESPMLHKQEGDFGCLFDLLAYVE
jgi:hypothetical protein